MHGAGRRQLGRLGRDMTEDRKMTLGRFDALDRRLAAIEALLLLGRGKNPL